MKAFLRQYSFRRIFLIYSNLNQFLLKNEIIKETKKILNYYKRIKMNENKKIIFTANS